MEERPSASPNDARGWPRTSGYPDEKFEIGEVSHVSKFDKQGPTDLTMEERFRLPSPGEVYGVEDPVNQYAGWTPRVVPIMDETHELPRYESEIKPGDHTTNYQQIAKELVRQTVLSNYWMDGDPEFEVYIVWFCKTLQNWKALLGTTLADSMYFEVTHNGDKRETYLDVYKKVENVTVYE
jgi:Family of unknown function (DUF6275)